MWQTLRFWAQGVRLYIGIGLVVASLQIWWWASVAFAGDTSLIAARVHEVCGWTALGLLAIALAIGPIYKLLPNLGGVRLMRDARRLIGVGAAWFACLHAGIAYFISFQAINIFDITTIYQQAFALGGSALLILLIMAFTSFNGAMKQLGIWWFRLHRLVYVAVILAIWHAFVIGVHATSAAALPIVIGAALVLLVSHVFVAWTQPKRPSIWQIATLVIMFGLIFLLSNYGIQQYIDRNSIQGHNHS